MNTSPFEDALKDLRITGNVLLQEIYALPWAIDVPNEAALQTLMDVPANVRVIPFHWVRHGHFNLHLLQGDSLEVHHDEVAICPGGHRHRMQAGARATPVSLEHILAGKHRTSPASDDPAAATRLICGVFLLQAAPLNPLLGSLPPVIKIATDGVESQPTLAHAAGMLDLELENVESPGNDFIVSRLLEIICA